MYRISYAIYALWLYHYIVYRSYGRYSDNCTMCIAYGCCVLCILNHHPLYEVNIIDTS